MEKAAIATSFPVASTGNRAWQGYRAMENKYHHRAQHPEESIDPDLYTFVFLPRCDEALQRCGWYRIRAASGKDGQERASGHQDAALCDNISVLVAEDNNI